MSALNPCTDTVLPTCSPLRQRWAHELRERVAGIVRRWREQAELRAQQRAISGLSDGTLRDIGLAERRFDDPTLGAIDWERGRW